MSTIDWRRYEPPLSDARLRAEMQWAVITGRSPILLRTFADVPEVRPPAPAPRTPRGNGKRKPKQARPVLVEKRWTKTVACPDGRFLASKRSVQTYITVAT